MTTEVSSSRRSTEEDEKLRRMLGADSKSTCGTNLGCLAFLLIVAYSLGIPQQIFKNSSGKTNRQEAEARAVSPHSGDLSKSGGTATVRRSYLAQDDDPDTTNDESNDQPVGHFGTITLRVYSIDAGHSYTLDGEVDDSTLERLYFPKGGWIDFYDCELDEDLEGSCTDEEGRDWEIEGEY